MLKIGWASADVSTNATVTITGQAYERISKGSMDPTTVTALYLEDGGDYVVFISGDFTSIEGKFLSEVQAAAEERLPGFDGKKIIFQSTRKDKKDADLYTIGVDGDNLTQLTKNKSHDAQPYWSNDGSVYFTSDRGAKKGNYQIWRFKLDD